MGLPRSIRTLWGPCCSANKLGRQAGVVRDGRRLRFACKWGKYALMPTWPMRLFAALTLLLVASPPIHAQGSPANGDNANAARQYPDSADGLKLLLQDAVAAAKIGDSQRVSASVKEMGIPNYQKWFTKAYGKEKGNSWAEPYGRDLAQNEDEMQQLFTKLAGEDGDIFARSVNDAPKGGEGGLEWGMVHTAKQRVDFFYAEWRLAPGSNNTKADAIGYFVFLDGKFRWDSAIKIIPMQRIAITGLSQTPNDNPAEAAAPTTGGTAAPLRSGTNGVGYPTCIYCPVPSYTQEARDAKLQGTVVLQLVVGEDGRATDVRVVKKLGHGMDEAAVAAVQNWRFKPAAGPGGKPVAVVIPLEVTFR